VVTLHTPRFYVTKSSPARPPPLSSVSMCFVRFRNINIFNVRRDSSVGIATRYVLYGGGVIFPNPPNRSWSPPILLYIGHRVIPGGKTAEAWSSQPPHPSSAEVHGRVDPYLYSLWVLVAVNYFKYIFTLKHLFFVMVRPCVFLKLVSQYLIIMYYCDPIV